MDLAWLSGWYDPELIDCWEEFVADWEETPLQEMGYMYFPPSHYSYAEAKSFVESQALKEVFLEGLRKKSQCSLMYCQEVNY